MKISEMNLEQVKQTIICKEQKIKSLHKQIEILTQRESQLIAKQNVCTHFTLIPTLSTISGWIKRCNICGQLKQAHKGHEPIFSLSEENAEM